MNASYQFQPARMKSSIRLEQQATEIGLGQIFYGPTVALNYNVGGLGPGKDPRSPDIIVTPNIGVTYSNSTSMIGDHGGFAHDDTNVILLVANPLYPTDGLGYDNNRTGCSDDRERVGARSNSSPCAEGRRHDRTARGWGTVG